MTYEHISREHGITIRVGDPVRHKEIGCNGMVIAPRPKARDEVRVQWCDSPYAARIASLECFQVITTEQPGDLLYLDLPVTAQLPEIGGETA
jgi:hypothetical protein